MKNLNSKSLKLLKLVEHIAPEREKKDIEYLFKKFLELYRCSKGSKEFSKYGTPPYYVNILEDKYKTGECLYNSHLTCKKARHIIDVISHFVKFPDKNYTVREE